MTEQIFLSGHGGWKPEQGYAKVPKGAKVHFYTDFAKNLITSMEYKILEGSYTEINRTIEEFGSCPNMLLSEQDDAWTVRSEQKLAARNDPECSVMVAPPGGMTLEGFFAEWATAHPQGEVEFHWMACQTLGLNQVGGRSKGLNAGDFKYDPTKPGPYRIKKRSRSGRIRYVWMDKDGKIVG